MTEKRESRKVSDLVLFPEHEPMLKDVSEAAVKAVASEIERDNIPVCILITNYNHVVGAFHYFLAVKELGWEEVPVCVIDTRFLSQVEVGEGSIEDLIKDMEALKEAELNLLTKQPRQP